MRSASNFVPHFEPFIASCDGYGREPEVRLTQLPPTRTITPRAYVRYRQ